MAEYTDVWVAVQHRRCGRRARPGINSTYPQRSYLLTWICDCGTTHICCTSEFTAPVAPKGIAVDLSVDQPLGDLLRDIIFTSGNVDGLVPDEIMGQIDARFEARRAASTMTAMRAPSPSPRSRPAPPSPSMSSPRRRQQLEIAGRRVPTSLTVNNEAFHSSSSW